MARIKKIALAALVALALAAGGVAAAPQAQLAWSLGASNPTNVIEPEPEQGTGDPSQSAAYKKGSFDVTELGGESVANGRGDCTACH